MILYCTFNIPLRNIKSVISPCVKGTSFDHVTPRAFKVHAMRDVHLKYSRAFKHGPLLQGNSF